MDPTSLAWAVEGRVQNRPNNPFNQHDFDYGGLPKATLNIPR